MKLGTCERCGYLTEERHDCDALLAVRAAVREAAAPPLGDARFVGAEGNRDPLGVMRGAERAPTPSAILAEAERLLSRARVLLESACDPDRDPVADRARDDIDDARNRISGLRVEAVKREGRTP